MTSREFGATIPEVARVLQLPAPGPEAMADESPLFAMYRAIGLVSLPLSPPEGPLSRFPCSLDLLGCRQSCRPAVACSLLQIRVVPVGFVHNDKLGNHRKM